MSRDCHALLLIESMSGTVRPLLQEQGLWDEYPSNLYV